MKILVTGGAGFIASHVADAYIAAGHDVCVVDDLSRGSEQNVNPKARFYKVDIRDLHGLRAVFEMEKPEIVNHHAAQMDVRRGVREPVFDAEVNILGSLNVLTLAVQQHVQRIIYISSAGAVYGEPAVIPVSEDAPINPIGPYGITKHTVEHYLFAYQILYGLPYVVLRYGNVYGPRQSSKGEAGVFAIFSEQILAGIQPVIYGDGSKTRDYIYVGDVAAANFAALEQGSGEIFNIGTGIPTSDYEVFRSVRDNLGATEVQPKYDGFRPGEVNHIAFDVSKARRVLHWEPTVSLSEGVRLTLAYFRENAGQRVPAPRV